MPEEMQNTNIKITSAEDTGAQIKIRDQNKHIYSFFKSKKDGGATAAFKNYQHFKIGDTVEISYKEVPYKEGSIKSIMNIKPATGPVETSPVLQGQRLFVQRGPGRDYWEQREAKRQSSIIMQVAFKAAVELQVAKIAAGDPENRERMYNETLEFYDFIVGQIGEGESDAGQHQASPAARRHPGQLEDAEDGRV